MRILVTGAAGYIGQVLCKRLLNAGHHVTALDNLMYGQAGPLHLASHPRFQFVYGDVCNASLSEKLAECVDIIIPLAAIVGAPACQFQPDLATEINLQAIWRLRWKANPDQLIIFPTTNSGYGTTSGEEYCTEEMPLQPISLYGKLKAEAENILLERPNTISLRLATVFGISPRMRLDLLVNDFVYRAVTDGFIVLYEKHFKRNYVHIRDVADCFIHCIKHPEMAGRAYNVGLDNANLSKEELALKIAGQVTGLVILESAIGSDPDQRNYIVSNERLRRAGFEAQRTLDQGIEELIRAYQMLPLLPGRNARCVH